MSPTIATLPAKASIHVSLLDITLIQSTLIKRIVTCYLKIIIGSGNSNGYSRDRDLDVL